MVRKSAKVISIDRIVDADLNISELEHRPSQVRQWFSNNIIRPMFSYLVGWTGTKAVMLRATAGGILKIADVGSGLERVESLDGTAGAAESVGIEFTEIISRVRIIANDYDMYFRPSRDGVNYEDQIHVKADLEQLFDLTCASFMVQRYGLNDVDYEVEGYR
jgi:hypothetical protein